MSLRRVWAILRKDLALGPRSPVFMYALVLPFAITLVLQVAFGSLFSPKPRLGIVDQASSRIAVSMKATPGIEVRLIDDADTLRRLVKSNDLDAGLVLPPGIDAAIRAGERPLLPFYIAGESYAANRIVLAVTMLDAIRVVEGAEPPVEARIVSLGKAGLPLSVRLVPLIVFYALIMAGFFVPGSSVVEEKERQTLTALLVTPTRTSEVFAAKWALGFIMATVLSVATLALNRALGASPLDVLAVVLVGAALSAMLGVLVGIVAKDSAMLFGIAKGSGWFLAAPTAFYVFPNWPQWIAKLFPLYWIIEPVWRVAVLGRPLSSATGELAVALAITAALAVVASALSRRMRTQIATG